MNLYEILQKIEEKTKGDFWKLHVYSDGSGRIEGMGEDIDDDMKFEFDDIEELEAWLEDREVKPTY
jgi:hypothetical protein